MLLTTILDPAAARADELAAAYHQRWEEETGNDQLNLRGPGRILHSRLPELAHQEIWAWLLVHHALSALITQAAQAADLDPDGSPSPGHCASPAAPPPVRRAFPPEDWSDALPDVLAQITRKINPPRRHRSCPRALKRPRHNSYCIKRPSDRNTHHSGPATINLRTIDPRAA